MAQEELRPAAWLHTVAVVNGEEGEQDHALSFDKDSFPLGDAGLFRGISAEPLYTADAIKQAEIAAIDRVIAEIKADLTVTENPTEAETLESVIGTLQALIEEARKG